MPELWCGCRASECVLQDVRLCDENRCTNDKNRCTSCQRVETQIEKSSASSPDGVISGTPILLADGERVWREYAVTQLRRRAQGEGKLFVTDLRLIFFAVARPRAGARRGSTLVFQTKLDQITGLATIVSRRVSFFWVLMTAILGLATLFQLLQGNATAAFVLLVLAAGAGFLVYRSIKLGGSVGLEVIPWGASRPSRDRRGEGGSWRRLLHECKKLRRVDSRTADRIRRRRRHSR